MTKFLRILFLCSLPFLSLAGPNSLQIVPNLGQWEQPFLYKIGTPNCDIYLENGRITYLLGDAANGDKVHEYRHDPSVQPTLKYHAYRMIFEGANLNAETKGSEPISTYYNYYLGNDQSKWKTGVHPFSAVTYKNLYTGIDALIKSDNGNFAYDFIVAAHADASLIKLKLEGADKIELKDGKLLIHNSIKTVEESVPYTYQTVNGEKKEVKCKYVLHGNTVSFAFPDGYDKSLTLVIDPSVVFVTYCGSTSSSYGFSATYDAAGNGYGAGEVFGQNYPVTVGAFQTVWGGGGTDINISKYSSDGTQQLYGTFLGGSNNDYPHSMVVDGDNNLIITGASYSTNFPVTTGCYDNSLGGIVDLIVSKFDPTGGVLLGSTFIGGSGVDGGNGSPLMPNYGDGAKGEVICDHAGNIYVAGNSKSADFPQVNSSQPALSGSMDAVAVKLNPGLTNLLWSTYLGGTGVDNAVVITLSNTESNIYIAGGTNSTNMPTLPGAYLPSYGGNVDGYVARYQNSGSFPRLGCTYIGTVAYDNGYGVQVDQYNGIYTMGQTSSGSFPVIGTVYSNPGSGHYIMKLDSTLSNVQFSTVFGNGQSVTQYAPNAFMVDSCLNIYFSGFGAYNGMPTTANAFQSSCAGGRDFYFIVLDPNAGNLLFGSYYGSSSDEHVDGGTSRFDNSGIIYQGICTSAPTFPGSAGGVFPTNLGGWNTLTMKINFEVGIVNAIASSNNATGCAPLIIQFQNNSSNATSYVWDFGDGSPVDNTSNPAHTYTDAGTYTVMLAANSTYACNFSDTTYITVIVDTGAVVSNFTYQKIDTCGPFTATFTNTSNGSDSASYHWDFGDNTTSDLDSPGLHTFPDSGIYNVTLIVFDSLSLCGQSDTFTQTITFDGFNVIVSASPSPSNRGCAPFVVQFQDGSTGADSYLWNFGDGSPTNSQQSPPYTYTQAGTFVVTLIASSTDPNACKNSDTGYLTIIVDTGLVSPDFMVLVTDSCDPGPYKVAIINTTSYVSPTTVFTWHFGDGSSYVGQYPAQHTYSGQGTYTITLVIEDSLSCNKIDSISKTITIRSFLVDAVAPLLPEVCALYDISFSHQSAHAQSVFWSLGDGATSTQSSFTHHYDNSGTYNVMFVATNPLACNGSDTMTGTIKVKVQAIADFTYTPLVPIPNETIQFENLSQFADTYLWDFGDGTKSQDVNPSKLYTRTDSFLVCLAANNKDECPDVVCKKIFADIHPLIDLPTGFSPNGDGNNDVLYVRGEGISKVNLKIFDRWGKLIFESNSMDKGWDGTYSGKEQPMEAYAYVLEATFIDGTSYQTQGNVTLIR